MGGEKDCNTKIIAIKAEISETCAEFVETGLASFEASFNIRMNRLMPPAVMSHMIAVDVSCTAPARRARRTGSEITAASKWDRAVNIATLAAAMTSIFTGKKVVYTLADGTTKMRATVKAVGQVKFVLLSRYCLSYHGHGAL